MGFLDSLFGGDKGPTPKRIADQVTLLQARHGEPARRYGAMEKLLEWDTPESIEALFLRYTSTAEKETSDEEEKAWLADKLVALGPAKVVPALGKYLRRNEKVGWAIRILQRLVDEEKAAQVLCKVLDDLDIHFDRHPQRKVEILHALMERASDPAVSKAAEPFLEDTDDTVRIAVGELLARSGNEEQLNALVDAFVNSGDRPRVQVELIKHMAEQGVSVKGRKAEVEPDLPEGYYLTREGVVKRLGQ